MVYSADVLSDRQVGTVRTDVDPITVVACLSAIRVKDLSHGIELSFVTSRRGSIGNSLDLNLHKYLHYFEPITL